MLFILVSPGEPEPHFGIAVNLPDVEVEARHILELLHPFAKPGEQGIEPAGVVIIIPSLLQLFDSGIALFHGIAIPVSTCQVSQYYSLVLMVVRVTNFRSMSRSPFSPLSSQCLVNTLSIA